MLTGAPWALVKKPKEEILSKKRYFLSIDYTTLNVNITLINFLFINFFKYTFFGKELS